jgi:hypothetical protein
VRNKDFRGQWDATAIAAVVLLALSVVLGGASRDHALRLAVVELASLPLLVIGLGRLIRTGLWRDHRFALALLGALVALPLIQLLPLPPTLTLRDAAMVPETFLTVWHNVFQLGRLAAGETLLVHGGASGIGIHGYTGADAKMQVQASNGCIRMQNQDAEEIYQLIKNKIGTTDKVKIQKFYSALQQSMRNPQSTQLLVDVTIAKIQTLILEQRQLDEKSLYDKVLNE